MRKLTNEELQDILEKHKKWLNGEEGGERADLAGTNLADTNLTGANLAGANLIGAYLAGANLAGSDLTGAYLALANLVGADLAGSDLTVANLTSANLAGANLTGAYLVGANLAGSDLTGAYLTGANLEGADLRHIRIDKDVINRYFPLVCPSEGSFIGWKKVRNDMIVKLLIPEDAKRSSAFGRKCRCNKAIVLSIESIDGTPAEENYMISSIIDPDFTYRVGETVSVSDFCEDRTRECAPGIHFFITREEAVEFVIRA